MLKLSFNIKKNRNPLQKHYCRGQTILSFEENLIKNTDELKKKVSLKAIKIILKHSIGQTLSSFDQKTCFVF